MTTHIKWLRWSLALNVVSIVGRLHAIPNLTTTSNHTLHQPQNQNVTFFAADPRKTSAFHATGSWLQKQLNSHQWTIQVVNNFWTIIFLFTCKICNIWWSAVDLTEIIYIFENSQKCVQDVQRLVNTSTVSPAKINFNPWTIWARIHFEKPHWMLFNEIRMLLLEARSSESILLNFILDQ